MNRSTQKLGYKPTVRPPKMPLASGEKVCVKWSVNTRTLAPMQPQHATSEAGTASQVTAESLHLAGYLLYQADNGLWLIDEVPAKYLHQGSCAGGMLRQAPHTF